MGGWDWTEDSRLLLERAREHQRELTTLLNGERTRLWSVRENARQDGTYVYALTMSSPALLKVKPVAADLANNLVHALDQAVAALARLFGHGRSRDVYFPWSLHDERFQRALKKLQSIIGDQSVDAILTVRDRHRLNLPHLQVVKELSNSGKHWELIPSEATVKAIALSKPGQPQQIWDIPDRAFTGYYEFCTSEERLVDYPFEILVGLRFSGLGIDVTASPETVFDMAFRYVEEMVNALCGYPEATKLISSDLGPV